MTDKDYIKQLEEAIKLANALVLSGEGVNVWYWHHSSEDEELVRLIKKLCE